jgi:hypothetical protein
MRYHLVPAITVAVLIAAPAPTWAQTYRLSVIASGLQRPVGIAVEGSDDLYFTEVPNPGIGGAGNGVSHLDLDSGTITRLSNGEPEPTNIGLSRNGDIYWTCKSAGVILRLVEETGAIELFAGGLQEPSGISVGQHGAVYLTEIPTPGVPGSSGGQNSVSVIRAGNKSVISMGEPEPTDVVVARNGNLYWTCKSAGVILFHSNGAVGLLKAGLNSPSGIALDHKDEVLYFTEVPTPGLPGDQGGQNAVKALDLKTGLVRTIHHGDPEPTDIAVARNGNLYWTCTVAGVIVEAKRTHGR